MRLAATGPVRKRDLTQGSILRLLLVLAAPAMLNTSLQMITSLLDAFWMGHVSSTALSAVAMGTTLRIVLISPMMGLSGGGLAIVARHIGAHEQDQADKAVMQCILMVILFVVPIMTIGHLFAPTFLRWMGTDGQLLDDSLAYIRIIFWGLLFTEMLPSINGVISGAGHPEQTLRINFVSLAVTAVAEPILALGLGPLPALGVRGAALATLLGNSCGVLAQMATLASGKAGVKLHLRGLRPDFKMMVRILRIAIPTSVQRFSPNLANALLMRLVSALGPTVLSAYVVITRIGGFAQLGAMGMSGAVGPMVGQNLGASQPDRATKAARQGTLLGLSVTVVLMAILNLWPAPTIRAFDRTPEVVAHAAVFARFLVPYTLGLGLSTIMAAGLIGAGDAISPLVVSVTTLWLVQLPLVWLLSSYLPYGPAGLWIGLIVGQVVNGLAMLVRFNAGKWKLLKI